MKTSFLKLAGAVLGTGLLALVGAAQGEGEKLSDFSLGEHISGDDVKLDKLEGKVVVIDYWGTR